MLNPRAALAFVVVFLLSLPAEAARSKTPSEKQIACALRTIQNAALHLDRVGLDRLRDQLLNNSNLLPNDRPVLEPVQLMLLKTLVLAGDEGLTDDEILDNMDRMGFLTKIGRGRANRGQILRRDPEQIHRTLYGMTSRNEGEGYYVRADLEANPPRFYATAFAIKELNNLKWFLGKVRGIADGMRRSPRVTTIRQWWGVLTEKGISKLDAPTIGRATAVVLAHLHPEVADFVTNLGGDAVFGAGLGTPSDTGQVYKILQELHATGLAERQYQDGRSQRWRACSRGFVGTDTSRELEKLQAWSTLEGEQALAQWLRFHYTVLDATLPRN